MGTAALTLGIVGLFTWIIPPLGFPISIIGLILGILERLIPKQHKGRAVAGIIMCILGIALNIGAVVGLLTVGWILGEILPEYFRY